MSPSSPPQPSKYAPSSSSSSSPSSASDDGHPPIKVATLIDRAIDHDQAIILTAELLRSVPDPRNERISSLLDQIVQTALKNSSLIAALGEIACFAENRDAEV